MVEKIKQMKVINLKDIIIEKQPIAMTIKSFCPLFSKSGQGQGAVAPCGILKGEAL